MPSLIGPPKRTKFRPCRGDVPKRTILYAPWHSEATIATVPYGDKIDGLVIKSRPARGAVVRSGIGTAHHLRRFPVLIHAKGGKYLECRLNRILNVVSGMFPNEKPKIVDGKVRVVLWADDAKKLREETSFTIQEV